MIDQLARLRVAARLGLPTLPSAADGDTLDAALVAAGHDISLAGIFAGRPPGPKVRAVPVDDARRGYLRFPRPPLPPARIGAVESWSTAEIGDAPIATVRCVVPLPGGVALGSDYGLTLWRGGFQPFPWPQGARREARRVEAMAVHRGQLHVATSQSLVTWDLRGEAQIRKHGRDEEDGWDDVRSMLATGDRLLIGWRTHLEGGVGPGEALSMVDANGVVYVGTLDGEIHVVDGGGPIRRFADHKGRPVRHLAYGDGALWVAALDALHVFDGASWTSAQPEPTALTTDLHGRVWAIAEGGLWAGVDHELVKIDLPLERPWAIAAVPGALWIGGRERVWRVQTT